jgi:hypothetical protein
MLRSLVYAAAGLLIFTGGVLARTERAQGQVKSVDPAKNTITVATANGDKTFQVPPGSRVLDADGKAIPGGLRGVPRKLRVEVTVDIGDDGSKKITIKIVKTPRPKP